MNGLVGVWWSGWTHAIGYGWKGRAFVGVELCVSRMDGVVGLRGGARTRGYERVWMDRVELNMSGLTVVVINRNKA